MNSIDEKYIQRINELVYDDNTIVTYTSLSKILKINVNEAQNLLDKYVKDSETLKQDFSCTYVIIGIKTDDSFSVSIINQNELEAKRNMMKTVVSQHVYSIQKTEDVDLTTLANVESFTEHNIKSEPLFGSVVSNKATKRKLKKVARKSSSGTDLKQENRDLKQENRPAEVKEDKVTENKNKFQKNSIGNFLTQASAPKSNAPKPKTESKTTQKSMMANFFSKTSSKTEKTNGHTQKESMDIDVKHDDNAEKISEKDVKDVSQEDDKQRENGVDEAAMEVDYGEPVEKQEQKVKSSKSKKNDTPKRNKKNKKRKTDGKSDQPSKKRKRIIEENDSDSDIFASSESEVEVVPDVAYFDEDYEEAKQVASSLDSKTRRMKQVTEEYMDEDGYMNTVAKYVMISDEEEGEEDKEQKPMNVISEKAKVDKPVVKNKELSPPTSKKDNSPKKSTKNGKGKGGKVPQNQPSIMNFFKKT